MKRFGTPSKLGPERIRHGSRRRQARIAAGAAVLAMVGGGAVLAPSAHASTVTNHIYVSDHGSPSCTVTFRRYDFAGNEVDHWSKTIVGSCHTSIAWDPAQIKKTYVHINSSSRFFTRTFDSTTGAGHDHCVLVKALGTIVYTGDETQGCNGR